MAKDNVVTLNALAVELKLKPKRMRIKLRKAAKNGSFKAHAQRGAWTFTPAEAIQVRKMFAKAA